MNLEAVKMGMTASSFEQQSAIRVLIVEDDDAQRQTLSDLIRDEGFEPVVCSNAMRALTLAASGSFGIAILDQRLPEMSGTQLLERLRVMQRGLRGIIHTAYGSFESAKDAVNLGAFAYVEKLGHPAELVRHVHRAAQAWMTEALQRSEAKYRQLVNSVQAIVWRSDPATGRFRFVSQEAEKMLGYPVRQWLSEPTFWQAHIHPEDRAWVLRRCEQATIELESQEFEYRMLAADGRIVWLRDFVNIIVEAGRPTELVGVMIDITEQKRTAEALRKSKDLLKEAQHLAHIGSWELDLETDTLLWSDEMFRIHGLEPGNLDGRVHAYVSTTVHPDDQAMVQAALLNAMRECGTFTHDYRILQPEGALRYVSAQGRILCNEAGKATRMVGVVQDITERKQAQIALHESEERYRTLVEHAAEAIVVLDLETQRFVDCNSKAEALYGLSREDLYRTGPVALSPAVQPNGRPSSEMAQEEIMRAVAGEVRVFEWVYLEASGRAIPCEVRLLRLPSAERVLIRGSVTDITERKQAEVALRQNEESFRLMFAHNPLPMWVYDHETQAFLDVNDAAVDKYGYSRDEFLAMTIEDIRPPEDIPRFRDYLTSLSDPSEWAGAWRHQKKDGTLLDVEITAHDFPYRQRPARLVLAQDITARKRLEREILEISNREQRRIGQDLHDGLGQLLTGIGFRIAELEGDLQDATPTVAADAAEVGQMVERAIAQTRALARGLDPVNVEQQGLVVALGQLADSIESIYGITCVFACAHPIQVQDPEVAIHIYRIAQESITNAVKHGQASRVEVSLAQKDDLGMLTISDNGIGLPDSNLHREGMGLRIMDYRARMIRGAFDVGTGAAGGTEVICRFPLLSVQQPAE